MKKSCTKCSAVKAGDEFYKNKGNPTGFSSWCKECIKARDLLNKEMVRLGHQIWYSKNRITVRKQANEYYKSYYEKNRNRLIKKSVAYNKKRYWNDLGYRLSHHVGSRIREALKCKNRRTVACLNFTMDELKTHLEGLFEFGMNWDNYGLHTKQRRAWHIDHKIPISSFHYNSTDDSDFKKC
jgi:hypothetical protein